MTGYAGNSYDTDKAAGGEREKRNERKRRRGRRDAEREQVGRRKHQRKEPRPPERNVIVRASSERRVEGPLPRAD